MTDSRMSDYDDFASYLHNPFAFRFLSPEEKTSIVICKRTERFVTGYFIENECLELLKKYFGNRNLLEKNGLRIQFQNLKREVINNHLIGLILYGTDIQNTNCKLGNVEITKYTTNNGNTISLTIESITRILIKEYINDSDDDSDNNNSNDNNSSRNKYHNTNVKKLCRKDPLFNKYFESVKSMNLREI